MDGWQTTKTPMRDLLFNPYGVANAGVGVARSDWPATVAFDSSGEIVDYQETIIDRQGSLGHSRDHYYRRFNSVRYGHVRR